MKEIAPPPAFRDSVIRPPGSKYEANRFIAAASLTDGRSVITGAPDNEDIRAAVSAFKSLGARIAGSPAELEVRGLGAETDASERGPIHADVGESGTLLRFLTAAAATVNGEVRIRGRGRIPRRPIAGLVSALERLGARITTSNGHAPLNVRSGALRGGTVSVPARDSSQFASALMLVGPRARGPLSIRLADEPVSAAYLDLTVSVMRRCGVAVRRDGPRRFAIAANARYQPGRHRISGDWTAAGYFFAAAAIAPGRVTVTGLDPDSPQGERRFPELLRKMGCSVEEFGSNPASFRIRVTGPSRLRGIRAAMGDIPDAVPTLAAIAPFAFGKTRIHGAAHLRHKESDRIAALHAGLARLGAQVIAHRDGLTILPSRLHPGGIHPAGDHRIAMALALIGLRVPGIRIHTPGVVGKSFPRFWRALAGLGARVADRSLR